MPVFDIQVRVKENKIEYKFFKKNMSNHLTIFPLGARLVGDIIEINENEIENDKDIPDDKRTADIILEIANKVTDTIKLTIDYPSSKTEE